MKLFGTGSRRRSGLTVIDERLTIRGDVNTDGTVRVDGRIEGLTHRISSLVVGRGGTVVGDVEATEVVVAGTLAGNVTARGRVEIESGATVRGDVRAGALVIREGASIDGQFRVEAHSETPEADRQPVDIPAVAQYSAHVAA